MQLFAVLIPKVQECQGQPRPPKMTPDPPYLIFNCLVLLCIDSYDSERRRILQHFSRSTRFANLCTAPKFSKNNFKSFLLFRFFVDFCKQLLKIWLKTLFFFVNFWWKITRSNGIRRDFVGIIKTSWNWLKFCQFPGNWSPEKKGPIFLGGILNIHNPKVEPI